jgi:6-phosphogluconolactonase
MKPDSIDRFATLDELQTAAADAFCRSVEGAVAERGRCTVSLSGGSTPKGLYQLLAGRELPWERIEWFWGDERNVPPDHPESNFRMVREALFDHVSVPPENIHPVPVDPGDPAAASHRYEAILRKTFGEESMPGWDIVLLGMGDDAHTASLFPETAALSEDTRWFVENWVEKFTAYRYTLTPPAINSGREIWFLVAGEAKREAIARVLSPEHRPRQFPSQLINPTRLFVTPDALPL